MVETVNPCEPCVILEKIPYAPHADRERCEHDAGIRLLRRGMELLGYDFREITYTEDGKPYFTTGAEKVPPFFSISHSFGVTACAISSEEIGCDIEKTRAVPRILDQELSKLSALWPELFETDDREARTRLWTIYEALGKRIGTGIPIDFGSLDISRFRIRTWQVCGNYFLSVVQ